LLIEKDVHILCFIWLCYFLFISALSVVRRKWMKKKRDGNVLKVEWEYFSCVV